MSCSLRSAILSADRSQSSLEAILNKALGRGQIPRSIERGSIEASGFSDERRVPILIPRSIERGSIEAHSFWLSTFFSP